MSDSAKHPPAQQPAGISHTLPVLKLIFVVVDWGKAKLVSSVFENEHVRFYFISKGRGTASSDILDVLGIGCSEKAIIICLEQDVMVPALLKEVQKQVGYSRAGAGIAFTIPLSGINHPILQVFKESILKNEKIALEKETVKMSTEIKHDLIMAVVNQGYSDELMTLARETGASGGTVINARGITHEGPVKFFGVSVQDEREIILMVTSRDKKSAIMQAVSQAYGITSQAGGIVFSLPVDSLMGLNLNIE